MAKALEGIRVLDFSRFLAGPWCASIMADMGAEVIRVERPGGADDRAIPPFAPDGQNVMVLSVARNKKGITLNLLSSKSQEVLAELVPKADVVLDNFMVRTKEQMGLTYDNLCSLNPRIIYTSVSGFGHYGPYSNRVAFDGVGQALSGVMSYTGFPGSPPTKMAAPYVDMSTALYAIIGTMMALFHRERTGEGQMVEVALMDAAVSLLGCGGAAAEYQLLGHARTQIGNQTWWTLASSFEAKDGWLMFAVLGNSLFRRLCEVMGREDLIEDPRFADDAGRFLNRDQLNPIIQEWVGRHSRDEVVAVLEEARVPAGKVNSIPEALSDPHVIARQSLTLVESPGLGPVPVPGVIPKLHKTPGSIERPAPLVGEHNEEIYCGLLGWSREKLQRLQEEGVI